MIDRRRTTIWASTSFHFFSLFSSAACFSLFNFSRSISLLRARTSWLFWRSWEARKFWMRLLPIFILIASDDTAEGKFSFDLGRSIGQASKEFLTRSTSSLWSSSSWKLYGMGNYLIFSYWNANALICVLPIFQPFPMGSKMGHFPIGKIAPQLK